MKTAVIALIISAATLTGCGTFKTNQVSLDTAIPVPKDRVFAFQEQKPGTVPVEVVRDTGALGSACYLAIGAKNTLIARLDTGEVVRFFIEPGPQSLSVLFDPMGKGLCGANQYLSDPVVEKHTIKEVGVTRFRLSSRMYRRPELEEYEKAE